MGKLQLEIYKEMLQLPLFQVLMKLGVKCACGSEKSSVLCCHQEQYEEAIDAKKKILPCIDRLVKLSNHVGLVVEGLNLKTFAITIRNISLFFQDSFFFCVSFQ